MTAESPLRRKTKKLLSELAGLVNIFVDANRGNVTHLNSNKILPLGVKMSVVDGMRQATII